MLRGFVYALWKALQSELTLQYSRLFLCVPICFAFGIAGYFSLQSEPSLFFSTFVFASSVGGALLCWHNQKLYICGVMFFLCALPSGGFLAAQLQTYSVFTPILDRDIGPVFMTGHIQHIETLDTETRDVRVTFSNLTIERLEPQKTPRKVRLRLKKAPDTLNVGQSVSALVKLMPPSAPSYPGGYDFRRHFFFKSIGAVGFVYRIDDISEPHKNNKMAAPTLIQNMRNVISERIHGALSVRQANIVEALIIGERGGIAEDDYHALRNSGLAHLLAISGLHVGLVAGSLFFMVRLLLSCRERWALHYPVKKWAAIIAMGGAFIYMVLAGATIPTQRAFIMTVIIFGAILIDRWPFSLRMVAISAFIVLLLSPYSLLSVSFQLSFAAVSTLVAFSEWFWTRWAAQRQKKGIAGRVALYFFGVGLTTVIASLATAPFALFHFQQVGIYGVLSNIISIPLMAFFVMPMGILSLLSMPFFLEPLFLPLMGAGVEVILYVAHSVSSLSGSVIHIQQWSHSSFVCLVLAGLTLIVLKGRLKILIACFCGLCAIVNFSYNSYDGFIAPNFSVFALNNGTDLYASSLKRDKFTTANWQRSLGQASNILQPIEHYPGMQCSADGCRLQAQGLNLAIVYNEYIYQTECGWADIILTPNYIEKRDCPKTTIDKGYIYRLGGGALKLHPEYDGLVPFQNKGQRPWN